jgi:DNA recombination protein RmuC
MDLLFLFIGIALGAVAGFLFAKTRFTSGSMDAKTLQDKELLFVENQQLLQQALSAKSVAEARWADLRAELDEVKKIMEIQLNEERNRANNNAERLAKAEEIFKLQKEKIDTQKEEIEALHKKLTVEFENIANRILNDNSQKFTEQNRNNLDIILNPLKERIKDFEDKVDKTYKAESEERVSLKTEIKGLMDLNEKLKMEANNLTSALKGDQKKQGNWGEIILERILEYSGLVKDREYKTQQVTTNVEGVTIKPDVIVFLPDQKHIIIDAKVSLTAYEQWVGAEDEDAKQKYIKLHVDSLRNHIRTLADKDYETAIGYSSPDFVLLFVPIESSFGAAVQADQELFSYAWERKIVIVSPSTLLATLRTIASVWKQDRQTRNAMEIARQSGDLLDKFTGFIESMQKIGKNLEQAQGSYSEAYNKLFTGKGNLINRARTIKELGAKTSKNLPQNILDVAEEDGEEL